MANHELPAPGAQAFEDRLVKRESHPVTTGALALSAALLCLFVAHGQGDPPRPAAAEQARAGPTPLYFGIAPLTQCHTRAGEREPVLCRCTEAAIWDAEDKHRDAFQALHSDRAREIGALLRLPHPVWQEKRCVSCHGVWIEDEKLHHRTFKAED